MELQSLGHYRLIRKIGSGGMGIVYLGRDERLDREVAIKVLPAGSIANEDARIRFRKEAQILSRLNHPNIATIYDFNTSDAIDFLAMEFVDGATLSTRIKNRLNEAEIVPLAIQISEALEDAHEKKIVHCDLKPQNIMVSARGRVKLLDFGVAQLTRPAGVDSTTVTALSASVGGSLPYMSPEQLSGDFPAPAMDVYSFGAVLYEMATQQRPFQESQPVRLADAILHTEPVAPQKINPQISNGLQAIILKCLKKKPGHRYESVRSITPELRRLASSSKSLLEGGPSIARKKIVGLSLAILAAAILALVANNAFHRKAQGSPINSLAVLPLQNFSGSKDQDYFVEGVTDELTSHLAQVGALNVVSRTSARAYKDSTKSVPEIAHELGVDAVVEGSVSRLGNRVRINAELIDARTDRHLWAQSYERDLTDTLALQTEVAVAIANAVNAKLTPREVQQLHDDRRVNPEAYDYFLRGRQHAAKQNPDDNQIAIELLEHSLAIDPSFAEAHAELGSTYSAKLFFYSAGDETLKQKAFSEVDTALRLNPELAEAHLAKGLLLWSPASHFAHVDAIAAFRHAIQLKPSLDEAHHQLGLVYLHIGFPQQGLEEVETAVKLNPGNTLARFRVGVAMLYAQRYAEADQIFSGVSSEFNPSLVSSQQAWVLASLGRSSDATRIVRQYLQAYPDDPGGMVYGMAAQVAAGQNKPQDAARYINLALKNQKNFGHFHHTAYSIASAYALQGNPKAAVQWLQTAADDGLPCYSLFTGDENLAKIRSSPEFKSFIAKQRTLHDKFSLLF